MLPAIKMIMGLAFQSSAYIESEQPPSNCLDTEHVLMNLLLSVVCKTM
jgi:hypothetical protein